MPEALAADIVAAHDEIPLVHDQDFCVVAGVALGPPDVAAEALQLPGGLAVLLAYFDFGVKVIKKNVDLNFSGPRVL